MRTIQEYLKECDRESIINGYIYEHAFSPISCMDENNRNRTLGEIIDYYREKLNGLIDKLISIEPVKTDERWILMAYHQTEDEFGDIAYSLFKESDLDKEGLITTYAYEFSPFEETVGFYVADNYLTQYELDNLIIDYLYEVSWNGFDQEYLEERIDEIITSYEDAEKHKDDENYFVSFDDVKEKIKEEFGFELEKKDPEQEKAWHELLKHQMEYNILCQRIEVEKLKETLCSENLRADGQK